MWIFKVVFCLFGKHERDRHRVERLADGRLHSRCVTCHRPLVRVFVGERRVWRPETKIAVSRHATS